MKALSLYYGFVAAFYLAAAGLLALAKGYAAAWFADAFPVIFSKEREPVEVYLRLLGVASLAAALSWSLWSAWWLGVAAAALVSGYEVYLSWTFYRESAREYMQLARLTFNAAAGTYCGLWLGSAWGAW